MSEIEAIVNDPCFDDEENNFEGRIDIFELLFAIVDVVSDEEVIDEDDLGEQSPKDITGCIEIPDTATGTDSAVSTDPENTEKEPPAKKPRKKVESSWRKTSPDFHIKRGSESNIDEIMRKIKEQFRRKSPVEVFEKLFDDEIRKHIVQQSTIYASQKNRHSFVFSDNCRKKLIGFFLLTGYHGLPQERMYWCEDEVIESDIVRACFSRNQYLEIKRNLHFNDNFTLGTGEHAGSFKIAALMKKMDENFLMYGVFSKHLSIDEQMVQYYSRHFMKQFIRGKPIGCRYKIWAMCCFDTGYCFNLDLYKEKKATE